MNTDSVDWRKPILRSVGYKLTAIYMDGRMTRYVHLTLAENETITDALEKSKLDPLQVWFLFEGHCLELEGK